MIGIGISIENMDSKDPAKWGENLLGKALMNIRDVLRSEQPSIKKRRPPVSSALKTSATTAEIAPVVPVSAEIAPVVPVVPVVPVSAKRKSVAKTVIPSVAVAKAASIQTQNEAPTQNMSIREPTAAAVSESASAAVSVPVASSIPVASSASVKRRPRVGSRINTTSS
jgi:hypothetical protein